MRNRDKDRYKSAHMYVRMCMSDGHGLGAHTVFVINTNSRDTRCSMYEFL